MRLSITAADKAEYDRVKAALSKATVMLDRVFNPDNFESTKGWFSGDGPYEDYVNELKAEGVAVIDEARKVLGE